MLVNATTSMVSWRHDVFLILAYLQRRLLFLINDFIVLSVFKLLYNKFRH